MRGIDHGYFVRRIGMFFLVVFVAASFNFMIPRLAPGNPIGAITSRMANASAGIENGLTMIGGVLPYYLMAMLLLYLFAFTSRIFPMTGAYDSGMPQVFSWQYIGSI